MSWDEIRVVLALFCLLTIPGWAFLSITRLWQHWPALQRWIAAIAISISFYPILFYFARTAFPSFSLGERKILILLFFFVVVIVWFQRKDWKSLFVFDRLEWAGILIFAATLFTRLWVAHLRPYPAWSDSLHHTLITELVAHYGRLPYTLEPYESASLNMYHLGLYSISGLVKILTKVPASMAILWASQFLNGLCGISVFFLLDYFGSRKGAVAGALVVGLLSFQPAWYVNWGRFTQVASQTILLIAWLVTWEALKYWRTSQKKSLAEQLGLILAASILNAGVFLLHFRVAGLYLPLLVISGLWELYSGVRAKKLSSFLFPLLGVGIVSLLLVLPILIPSLTAYIQKNNASTTAAAAIATTSPTTTAGTNEYYDAPPGSLYNLGIQSWLFVVFIFFMLVGLISRDKVTLSMLLWLASLWLIGHAYKVNLYSLTIINYTGIIIMFYLPFSVVIGRGCDLLLKRFSFFQQPFAQKAMLILVLIAAFAGSHFRVAGVEEARYFVTPSDIKAMDWIRSNLPEDAAFAITTYNWLGNAPHGVDAGFWIPYFTGRKTTTGTMLFSLGSKDYFDWVLKTTNLVLNLDDEAKVKELCGLGVHYLYSGRIIPITNQPFDIKKLSELPSVSVLYDQEGVYILQLCH